jgi:hypothetical protein
MHARWLLICIFITGLCFAASAQWQPYIKIKQITFSQDTIELDSLSIVPGSLTINGFTENKDFRIDYANGRIINIKLPAGTSVNVRYQTVAYDFKQRFQNKKTDIIQPEFREIKNPFLYTPENSSTEFFNREGIKMNGNLSRGLAFGNNQDLVLNSNLNLQLAGKLANEIDVLAAISDENNPIQPEGNTQQLQDFDKVFIRLSKNTHQLTVGDFEMIRPSDSYFMNYYKKSRGGQIQTSFDTKGFGTTTLVAEGAISRGRFSRNIINGIEGNQGPYRLSGANGETFIIIISGTEAVYLDGEKLTRGEQNDYVIDYNSGEIIFMPRRIITQYSRIIVEFQYADRNYARSVFHLHGAQQFKQFKFYANYFTEQDHKDQPFLQNLTDSNKKVLAAVGDRLNDALAVSENPVDAFIPNRILYRKVDTLGYTGVYVHATDAQSAAQFYEVRFSFTGTNRGNYVLAQTAANGRVFRWVEPVGGVPQGDYEPVTLLVSPKRLQMINSGVVYQPGDNTSVQIEAARSMYDKNLFSDKDKADDGGNGFRAAASHTVPLGSDKINWVWKTEANYEFVDQNFRYVERYRNVEFDRIWNRLLTNQPTADTGYLEHILFAKTGISHKQYGNIFYQTGYYNRDKIFTGAQHLASASLRAGKYQLLSDAEFINTKNSANGPVINNEVVKYRVDGGRSVLGIFSGAMLQSERSNFRRVGDTLLNGSYAYNQYGLYVRNNDSGDVNFRVDVNERRDFQPRIAEMQLATTARTANANVAIIQRNNNRLVANAAYREFILNDTAIRTLQNERTLLSRIEYDYSFIKRVFTANTYYQVGSGNELRRDFQYLEVLPGQGQYVWRDFNGDGTQTLNEFLPASAADRIQANYIRIFLPTNSLIRVNNNQFNQTLNINPATAWYNVGGWKKQLARWSTQTALRMERKTTDLNFENFLNPFVFNLNDSQVISTASVIRNTLFFNRSDPKFGFDISHSDSRSKNFLTNGFDTRQKQEQGINTRWNFSAEWGITISYNQGIRSYTSDFFISNNYRYTFDEIKPKLIWQTSQRLRVTGIIGLFNATTPAEFGNIKGTNTEYGGEGRYAIAKTGVINVRYSYYSIKFNGDIASPLGYDMMQGLANGINQIWNINLQQRVGGNIQITFNYDGRKSEGQNTIHIGRVEARYLF